MLEVKSQTTIASHLRREKWQGSVLLRLWAPKRCSSYCLTHARSSPSRRCFSQLAERSFLTEPETIKRLCNAAVSFCLTHRRSSPSRCFYQTRNDRAALRRISLPSSRGSPKPTDSIAPEIFCETGDTFSMYIEQHPLVIAAWCIRH